MGRAYPRFLYSEAANAKSQGPFIIHTLPPRFIAKASFDKQRRISVMVQDMWDEANLQNRRDLEGEASDWFNFSGRQYSTHLSDKILLALESLDFLKDRSAHFTVEQAMEVVKICFPTPVKTINERHSSYGLKHLMERISERFIKEDFYRYCSNSTMKEAFKTAGFRSVPADNKGLNEHYNISESDFTRITDLTDKR